MKKLPAMHVCIMLLCIALCHTVAAGESRLGESGRDMAAGRDLALSVGINGYVLMSPLRYCVNDAISLKRRLEESQGFRKVTLLTDVDANGNPQPVNLQPTANMILSHLAQLARAAMPEDRILFFFSGHGIERNGVGSIIPVDGNEDSALPLDRIIELMAQSRAKQKMIIIDACRPNGVVRSLASARGLSGIRKAPEGKVGVLISCSQDQYSNEDTSHELGVFARVFDEALQGRADFDADGVIAPDELVRFLDRGMGNYFLDSEILSSQTVTINEAARTSPFLFIDRQQQLKKEQERIEREQIGKRLEQERYEREQLSRRLEQERQEREQLARRMEQERYEQDLRSKRMEQERLERGQYAQRLERERLEAEQMAQQLERERQEQAERARKLELEKQAQEERAKKLEQARQDQERLAKKLEQERLEQERLAKKLEQERLEQDRLAKIIEQERLEQERLAKQLEQERLAKKQEQERLERERREKERLEKERQDRERLERERAERERAERERAERERVERERQDQERRERERLERERLEKERLEQKRLEEERARLELERLERERVERERFEKEKQALIPPPPGSAGGSLPALEAALSQLPLYQSGEDKQPEMPVMAENMPSLRPPDAGAASPPTEAMPLPPGMAEMPAVSLPPQGQAPTEMPARSIEDIMAYEAAMANANNYFYLNAFTTAASWYEEALRVPGYYSDQVALTRLAEARGKAGVADIPDAKGGAITVFPPTSESTATVMPPAPLVSGTTVLTGPMYTPPPPGSPADVTAMPGEIVVYNPSLDPYGAGDPYAMPPTAGPGTVVGTVPPQIVPVPGVPAAPVAAVVGGPVPIAPAVPQQPPAAPQPGGVVQPPQPPAGVPGFDITGTWQIAIYNSPNPRNGQYDRGMVYHATIAFENGQYVKRDVAGSYKAFGGAKLPLITKPSVETFNSYTFADGVLTMVGDEEIRTFNLRGSIFEHVNFDPNDKRRMTMQKLR